MANWLYILRNINKKWEILHTHTHTYIYILRSSSKNIYIYIYIEKMHKNIKEGETNQLYICIIVKHLLHLIL